MNCHKRYANIHRTLSKVTTDAIAAKIIHSAIDKYPKSPIEDHQSDVTIGTTMWELMEALNNSGTQTYTFDSDDLLHSYDGKPAMVDTESKTRVWMKHGKIHRTNGPAVITGFSKEWWIEDVEITDKMSKWAKKNGINLNKLTEDDIILIQLLLENFSDFMG